MARFLRWEIANPVKVVAVCAALVFAAGWYLPQIEKDLRSDAFLSPDHPALVYRDRVKQQFGLTDPLIFAVVDQSPRGIYRPQTLEFIQALTESVTQLDNVNSARVVSLATQNDIVGTADGMEVKEFLAELPETVAQSEQLRSRLKQFPLYLGTLVSPDGQAALVIAELSDEDFAESTYQAALNLLARLPQPEGVEVHVAGEGAVMGYLVSYVDADARRLVPVAGLVILLILYLAFRQIGPVLVCALLILATLVTTLGVMSAQGVPIYVISNALPVILVGISVADGVHVYSHYFALQAAQPSRDRRELVVVTMLDLWRPVMLTSLTTIAGFLGLYIGGFMPPFMYFGLYAAIGVGFAWFFTVTLLPVAIALTRPTARTSTAAPLAAALGAVGKWVLGNTRRILLAALVLLVVGISAALSLEVDDDPIGLFQPDEPLVVADRVINRFMRGSNTFDIVIEAADKEALFEPSRLRRIEALQDYVARLPHIGGSASVVDYIKQMNRAMLDGEGDAYRIPDDSALIAQYFLIYSAMSDPTDFEDVIDNEYRLANIRVNARAGGYQESREFLEPLARYIATEFNQSDMKATVTGRVNLNYHWIRELSVSHFQGLAISLVLVWSVSALLFRSALAGLYTLAPVCCTVVGIYVAMVVLDISLGMGTSMFAAIAVGLGVDYAIHTLDRFRALAAGQAQATAADLCQAFYRGTGLALFFNFLAIAGGFGILVFSKVVSLNQFGTIMMFAITVSFLAAMTLLPALVLHLRPAFVFASGAPASSLGSRLKVPLLVVVVITAALLLFSRVSEAREALSAEEVVARVNAVDSGQHVTRKLVMTLVDRHGKERQRELITYRKQFEGEERTVVFYLAPANVRDTAFLIWDYADAAREDDQWLYLPALRKVRRISAADRGDYFLGTDFTYEDIKLDGELASVDYDFSLVDESCDGACDSYRLVGLPKTDTIARELGYSRMEVVVDPSNWMVVRAEFWDLKGNPLKALEVSDIVEVEGIWTRTDFIMRNQQTGHHTRFEFSDVDYRTPIDDAVFTRRALERGH